MGETTIGGYEVLGELADSKRYRAFRASRRASDGERRGTLYLMTDEVRHPDLFIETVDAIREAWPFAVNGDRDSVLPRAQLWTGRPWFFLPERLPVASSARIVGRAAFASLRAQLRWLEQFHPPTGEPHFAHGDVRKERIAVFDAEQPLLIAPGWVAASELARGNSLSHVRGDDIWHLGKLWIQESDHSFVPDGMEPEPDEVARRLPRANLTQRSGQAAASPKRTAAKGNGAGVRDAAPQNDVAAQRDVAAQNDVAPQGKPATERERAPREAAATPPPGRAAARRGGSAVTAAPAARTARPVRETPPAREAARQSPFAREASPRPDSPFPREASPRRDSPFPREASARRDSPFPREASPLRDSPFPREPSPLRELTREGAREGREPALTTPSPAPARAPAAPLVRTPASAVLSGSMPPVRGPATSAPTVPVTPVRTPAGPPVSAPPVREAARARPARQTPPSPVAGPPPYDNGGARDGSPSLPVAEIGPPPAVPAAAYRAPEPTAPAPVAASYYPPQRPPAELAAPGQASSLMPSPARVSAPPKRRGLQIAIFVVLLVLALVFVVALTMLKS